MWSLQFGEFPVFGRVIGEFVVGKESAWNDVGSHVKTAAFELAPPNPVETCSPIQRPIWRSRKPARCDPWRHRSRAAARARGATAPRSGNVP